MTIKQALMHRPLFNICVLALTFVWALSFSGCSSGLAKNDRFRDLISDIDASLERREEIIEAKRREIKELSDSIAHEEDYAVRAVLSDRLTGIARHFQIDSMLCYHSRAYEDALAHGDDERAMSHWIRSIELFPLKIRIYEAITAIDTTDVSRLSRANRIQFYKSARQAYIYLLTIYSPENVNYEYLEYVGRYSDLLVSELAENDDGYKLYKATSDIANNNLSLSIATLRDYMSEIDSGNEHYVDALGMLSLAYFMRGRFDDWTYCLGQSALIENEKGFLDGESLRQFGRCVYEKGDATKAYEYIVTAEDNESKSGAVVRNVQVSDTVPMISNAYRESERDSTVMLCVIVGCLIVILLLIVVLFYRRARERAELAVAKEELAQANATKEVYLGRFLSLCYIYMDKIEDVVKLVSRKIAAGQVEDLYHMVRTGKIEDEQRQLFYKEFDDAFIHIYPTFIHDVNVMMKDGVKLGDEDTGRLTPELRILALMRLGLDDSAKIARFLNLSVNTVYTYRNRMKGRAVNRDEFESMVMAIGRL